MSGVFRVDYQPKDAIRISTRWFEREGAAKAFEQACRLRGMTRVVRWFDAAAYEPVPAQWQAVA